MKIIAFAALAMMLVSCGKESTRYLVTNKDSKKYQQLRALKQKECINESKIFKVLDKVNQFKYWEQNFKPGTLFRQVNKLSNRELEIVSYFKVISLSGGTMTIQQHSTDESQRRLIEFELLDGKKILSEVLDGVCHAPKKLYSHTSLDSTDSVKFTHVRKEKDGSDKDYRRRTETFELDKELPLILFNWTGKVIDETSLNGKKETITSTRTLKEVSKCDSDDSFCKKFPDPDTIPRCLIDVTQNAASVDDNIDISLISLNCQ